MHEMSLVEALMGQVQRAAREHRLSRVEEVEIVVGTLKEVVPELIQTAFAVATEGTIAAGALLKITEVKASVRCQKCQKVFEPRINNFLCPDCQVADAVIVSGNEFFLQSITGNKDEPPSSYEEEGQQRKEKSL